MLRILHVDDSRNDFELARIQLEKREQDVTIDWADSGESALEKVAAEEYDCILCDFQMPGKDGLELLTSLREAGRTIPFIFLTGQGNEEIASEAFRSGADDYYTKDVGFAHYDRLLNSIKRVVDAHQRRLNEEQATQALQKREEEYQLLFSGMLEGFAFHEIILDEAETPVDYRFLNINPAFERLTGLRADQIIGKRVTEIIPDLEPIWIERYGRVALTGEPCRFEDFNQNLDMHFEVHAFSPKKGHFACIFQDITKRKRAEQGLRKSEEEYRILIENAYEAIFVARDGKIVFHNPMTAQMIGSSNEEIVSMPFSDFIHPDDREMVINRHFRRLSGEDVLSRYTFRILHKDGSVKWVELNAVAITWKGTIATLNFLHDITVRMSAESALRESEEKYRSLFETMEQAVVYQDTDGRVISANPAAERILGVSIKDMQGRTSHDPKWEAIHEDGSLFHGDEHPAMVAMRTGEPVSGVIMGIHHHESNERRWIYINATPQFRPDEAKPYQVFATFSDITARKHYEEELKRYADQLEHRTRELVAANEDLETFSYSVSHDLRRPLRHIDGYIQLIQEDNADSLDEKGAEYFDRVRKSVSEMNQLIDGILTLSRITSAELARAEVDLTALARKVADSLASEEPESRVDFRIAEGLKASADPRLMQAVIENLIGNAWKFTRGRDHAVIEFGCKKEGKQKVYFIRDNGVGFDSASADKLFIPFSRLHDESEFRGTGIGLATVKRIINRHGGDIRAEGETDKGATFYFTLG